MSSFSERLAGDVTRETEMGTSDITVEGSREAAQEDLATSASAEPDGKLSLRMKLVTPVEEGSSGSERFSLQSKCCSTNNLLFAFCLIVQFIMSFLLAAGYCPFVWFLPTIWF